MPVKKRKTKRKTTTRRKKTTRRKTAARGKKTARRAKTRRTTTKKATTRKKATRKTSASVSLSTTAIKSAYTKSQLMTAIADATELSKKDVTNVIEALRNVMHRHLKKGGARQFTVPGLMKCVVKHRPARPARKGINPFTGEETTFKAKPATNVVKVRPLKSLKDMAD